MNRRHAPAPLSDAEIATLLRWLDTQPDHLAWRIFVGFGLLAGLRVSESLARTWVDIHEGEVEVTSPYGKTRAVPLPARLREELRLLRELNPQARPGDRILPAAWRTTASKALGSIHEVLPGFRLFHLRGTFIRRAIDFAGPELAVEHLSRFFDVGR